jgi:hypothetical protein
MHLLEFDNIIQNLSNGFKKIHRKLTKTIESIQTGNFTTHSFENFLKSQKVNIHDNSLYKFDSYLDQLLNAVDDYTEKFLKTGTPQSEPILESRLRAKGANESESYSLSETKKHDSTSGLDRQEQNSSQTKKNQTRRTHFCELKLSNYYIQDLAFIEEDKKVLQDNFEELPQPPKLLEPHRNSLRATPKSDITDF